MNLLEFISDPARKAQLVEATGSSPGYLWQIATGWQPKGAKRPKRASHELAQTIERETERIGPERVTKESLRPDIWLVGPSDPEPLVDAAQPKCEAA